MLTEVALAAVTEAVFGYLLEEVGVADKVRSWLGRDPQRLAFQVALARAYTTFARHHPQWAASFFDEHFLTHGAAPHLARCLRRTASPDPAEVAAAWADQLGLHRETRQERIAELTPVASDFLHWLQAELRARSEFQPLFNSRALDAITVATAQTAEAVEALWVELRQVLANATLLRFTTGIATLPTDYAARIQNFLTEYLGTASRPVPFGGRDADLARLDAWLDHASTPPYLMLTAPAGRGKSALLVRWCQRLLARQDLAIVFIPVSIRFRTNLASVVFSSLTARLAELHGEKLPWGGDTSVEVWRGMASSYLARPLPDGRRLLVILDGVDEAADWQAGPDLFPLTPLPGLRAILSARYLAGDTDAAPWLHRLGWEPPGLACTLDLAPLTREGVADVLRRMGFPLDQLGARVDIVAELHRLSEGDPLLVRLYVDDLWARGEATARLQPEDLRAIRPGLEGYFERWWDDQRKLWGSRSPLRERVVQTVLNLLSCALGPLGREDVLRLAPPEAGLNTWMLEEALYPLARLIIGDGRKQGYVFSHPRLTTYFYERLTSEERQAWEGRFLAWGKETLETLHGGQLPPEKASTYLVQYYGAHLERTGGSSESLCALVHPKWLQAWEALEGTYSGFLNDVARAWEMAGRSHTLSLQIRCALVGSTIHSLTQQIPPELLVGMTQYKSKLMSPTSVLDRVRQLPRVWQRADALHDLAAYLPEQVLPEALDMALAIGRENERGLLGLAPFLTPDLLRDALHRLSSSVNEFNQARFVEAAISTMPDQLLDLALLTARQIQRPDCRAVALSCPAARLPDNLRHQVVLEALSAASQSSYLPFCARALMHLAPYVSPEQIEATWNAPKEPQHDWLSGKTDESYALLAQAYSQAGMIDQMFSSFKLVSSDYYRFEAISRIAPGLAVERLPEMLDCLPRGAFLFERPRTLGILARYGSADLQGELLNLAREEYDDSYKLVALASIAPHLRQPETQNQVWGEVSAILHQFGESWNRWSWDKLQRYAYKEVVEYLPTELVCEIVQESRGTWHWHDIVLASLNKLSEHLRKVVCSELLAQARLGDLDLHMLIKLAPHVSLTEREELFNIALQQARRIGDEDEVDALAPYQAHISGVWEERESHRYFREHDHVRVLLTMTPYASQPRKMACLALEALNALVPDYFGFSLREVIPLLPFVESDQRVLLIERILEIVKFPACQDEFSAYYCDETDVLVSLAAHTSGDNHGQVMEHILSRARETPVRAERVLLLSKIFDYLSELDRQTALVEIEYWLKDDVEKQKGGLYWLDRDNAYASHPVDLVKSMAYARLAACAPQREHGALLEQALIELAAIEGNRERALALAQVASFLPMETARPLVERAIALVIREDVEDWAPKDHVLLSWLPDDLKARVLVEMLRKVVVAIDDYKRRPHILISLVAFWAQLPIEEVYRVLQEVLPLFARGDRKQFLWDLHAIAPVVLKLGGADAIETVVEEVHRVMTWWP